MKKWRIIAVFSILALIFISKTNPTFAQTTNDWFTAGGNYQRTSWVDSPLSGNLRVEWFQAIESYIDPNMQIVAVDGILYLATANGLLAMNADTGAVVWRYDTAMPFGHTPTVINGVVYTPSLDKRIHARRADNGEEVWTSAPAQAGFGTNPIVLTNKNKVYAGNRDGYFYAFNMQTGAITWQYPLANQPPIGSIAQSAAYDPATNELYFASNDNYAYAIDADTGELSWKSEEKLIGEGFRLWWPVVYGDYVVFTINPPYMNKSPGIIDLPGNGGFYHGYSEETLYPGPNTETPDDLVNRKFIAGGAGDNTGRDWKWIDGVQVFDMSHVQSIMQANPYMRSYQFINKATGRELDYAAPFGFVANKSGPPKPPLVMPNGVIYATAPTSRDVVNRFRKSHILGWELGTQYVTRVGSEYDTYTVHDEPQLIVGAGNRIARYRWSATGSSVDISTLSQSVNSYWPSFDLQAPGHDSMFKGVGSNGAVKVYAGTMQDSVNALFTNYARLMTPHQGRLYVVWENGLMAFGNVTEVPEPNVDVLINPVTPSPQEVNNNQLVQRLVKEVNDILSAGDGNPASPFSFLTPASWQEGQDNWAYKNNYFDNPGETLATLSVAYQTLSDYPELLPLNLLQNLKDYLAAYYTEYFGTTTTMYANTGWAGLVNRNDFEIPPEIVAVFRSKSTTPAPGWGWNYPQYNLYALYQYAKVAPESIVDIYNKAKSKVELISVDNTALTTNRFVQNGHIAGYYGFLGLYNMHPSRPAGDTTLRNNVQTALNNHQSSRAANFVTNSPYEWNNSTRKFNMAHNFILLTPELGSYLSQYTDNEGNALQTTIQSMMNEFDYIAPYWFISGYQNGATIENTTHHWLDVPSLFQARAYILNESKEELIKYLDAPTVQTGDLYYIQNLIAIINAPDTTSPLLGDANNDGSVDGVDYVVWLNHYNQQAPPNDFSVGNFNNDSVVDGLDYVIWLNNYQG